MSFSPFNESGSAIVSDEYHEVGKQTRWIEIHHAHLPRPVIGQETHLSLMHQEVCIKQRNRLKVLADYRELVWVLLFQDQPRKQNLRGGTHLERNEPHALDYIADKDEVLEHLDARNIEHHVEESQAHQAVVVVKALDVDLRTSVAAHLRQTHLRPVRMQQISSDIGKSADRIPRWILASQFQAKSAARLIWLSDCLDDLENVYLHRRSAIHLRRAGVRTLPREALSSAKSNPVPIAMKSRNPPDVLGDSRDTLSMQRTCSFWSKS